MIAEIYRVFKNIHDAVSTGEINPKMFGRMFGRREDINRAASDLVCQFPLIVPDTIDLDIVKTIVQSLELKYAALLHLVLSSNAVVELVDTHNAFVEFIRQYHTNLMPANALTAGELQRTFESCDDDLIKTLIKNGNIQSLKTIDEDLNSTTITGKKELFHEAPVLDKLAAAVDKINASSPTILKLNIMYKTKDRTSEQIVKYVGVKVILHVIDAHEMIENIANTIKTKTMVFTLIRWTTGEIKFWKDFLFAANEMRNDAKNATKENSFWWHRLKSFSTMNKFQRLVGTNNMIPNATIMINPPINDELHSHGIDLLKTMYAKKLTDVLFLLGIVYVDEELKKVLIWDSNTSSYTTSTLSEMERTSDGLAGKDLESILKITTEKRYS